MHDMIVIENLHFRPSTRKRKAGVFKNLHSGERFWKDTLSMTFFTGHVWTVGQPRRKNLCFQSEKFMRGLGLNYVSRLHHICNCKRRVLSTLTLSQYTVRRLNQMLRKCRSKVELIQLGSAHEKYGVWTRPKSTREWISKINLSSFQIKNFSKFLLGWLARENQNIWRHNHVYTLSCKHASRPIRASVLC